MRKIIATVKVSGNATKMTDKGLMPCGTTEIDMTNFTIESLERWLPYILEVNYIRE